MNDLIEGGFSAMLNGLMPATLFRRYRCDGSGSPGAVREERILDGTVQRLADFFGEPLPLSEGEYFIATDAMDVEWSDVLAMKARGAFRPADRSVAG